MPFKKVEVHNLVKDKRDDPKFNEAYNDIEKEYALIRSVVEVRKKLGLTQKGLAELTGMSQQEISRFENEKHIPKLTRFIRILDALDLEVRIESKDK